MGMNLHHLAIFQAIADTGGISAAALRLRISQPALSRELKTFESRLGVQLFERHARGMRLTAPGKVLHAHATRLFSIADSASAAMQDFADARAGQIHLGASNTIGTYVLPHCIARFRAAFPGIGICIFVGNTRQVAEGVADLRFDAGLVEGRVHVEGLDVNRFRRDRLVPVVAAGHPLARRKRPATRHIAGLPLLMREPGSGTRELIIDMLKRLHIAPGEFIELGNAEALKQAAIHGAGIAWLPRISVTGALQDGSLVQLPIPAIELERDFCFVHRSRAYQPPALKAFLDMVAGQGAG